MSSDMQPLSISRLVESPGTYGKLLVRELATLCLEDQQHYISQWTSTVWQLGIACEEFALCIGTYAQDTLCARLGQTWSQWLRKLAMGHELGIMYEDAKMKRDRKRPLLARIAKSWNSHVLEEAWLVQSSTTTLEDLARIGEEGYSPETVKLCIIHAVFQRLREAYESSEKRGTMYGAFKEATLAATKRDYDRFLRRRKGAVKLVMPEHVYSAEELRDGIPSRPLKVGEDGLLRDDPLATQQDVRAQRMTLIQTQPSAALSTLQEAGLLGQRRRSSSPAEQSVHTVNDTPATSSPLAPSQSYLEGTSLRRSGRKVAQGTDLQQIDQPPAVRAVSRTSTSEMAKGIRLLIPGTQQPTPDATPAKSKQKRKVQRLGEGHEVGSTVAGDENDSPSSKRARGKDRRGAPSHSLEHQQSISDEHATSPSSLEEETGSISDRERSIAPSDSISDSGKTTSTQDNETESNLSVLEPRIEMSQVEKVQQREATLDSSSTAMLHIATVSILHSACERCSSIEELFETFSARRWQLEDALGKQDSRECIMDCYVRLVGEVTLLAEKAHDLQDFLEGITGEV